MENYHIHYIQTITNYLIMKVYISKYALTTGIIEIEAEICESVSMDMIKDINRKSDYYHGEGKEWHRTKESAIRQANTMRERKLKALHTQINKLNKLTFN